MKRVFIIHGWGGNPKEPMLDWLKKELKKRKYNVINPKMPLPDVPKIKDWINHLKEVVKNPDKDVYFIGHSIGCQAVLRYLQTINKKVGGCVLIAPWMHLDEQTIEEEGEEIKKITKPWMETPIKWKKILNNLNKKTICILSDNDPYVPLSNGDLFRKNLKAKVIIEHNNYHFDPGSNIKKLPSALNSLLKISK